MKAVSILLLDDEKMVVDSLRNLIELETEYITFAETSPFKALEILDNHMINVIVTDYLMPGMDGIEFLLEAKKKITQATTIILTGYAGKENAVHAINEIGIYHYVEKPWDNDELLIIIKNAVERGDLLTEISNKYKELKEAYVGTIYRLATAAEAYDDSTFTHVLRISLFSSELARLSGENEDFCHTIKYASMMHDIGKIGIPLDILNKEDSLTVDEYKIVQKHTENGAVILRNPENSLLKMAHDIALNHHEQWNGEGYPKGLHGDSIPKSARIVAVADMFDALLSERSYKPNFLPGKVRGIIETEKGWHLDPVITGILLDNYEAFTKIYDDLSIIEGEDLSKILFNISSEPAVVVGSV
ncbi:MAG: response regulator [Candidatus Latescibacteria bacterium]|nr:response regulator [Candidatus Latescibacterota bacterium]